tara:strand:- start:1320 stop:1550 length:231 start_codon:yes stop_codon:yes gene_type:complete
MDKQEQEIMHDLYGDGLLSITGLAAKSLDIPHVVYVGIQFFTRMAVDLAPSEEEGIKVIHEAIENYMKERSEANNE